MDVQPEIQDIETNPALNQTMAPNEPVAIITLSVKMNGIQTYINLCIPYIAIEKVLDKIVIKYWTGTETLNKNEDRNIMKKRIEDVPLKLTAILGKTQIFIKNFLDLQAGDVITFDNSVKAPIDLYIENNLCYKVIPGTYNKKRAVQIAQIIEKDVEGYE